MAQELENSSMVPKACGWKKPVVEIEHGLRDADHWNASNKDEHWFN